MDDSITEINRYIAQLSLPWETLDPLSFCNASQNDIKEYLEQLPHSNPAEI
jgi:hypothetical protein